MPFGSFRHLGLLTIPISCAVVETFRWDTQRVLTALDSATPGGSTLVVVLCRDDQVFPRHSRALEDAWPAAVDLDLTDHQLANRRHVINGDGALVDRHDDVATLDHDVALVF